MKALALALASLAFVTLACSGNPPDLPLPDPSPPSAGFDCTSPTVLSGVVPVDDPIPGRYTLEVTSPGLERQLRTPAHFQREVGKDVTVRLRDVVAGDRRIDGVLVASVDNAEYDPQVFPLELEKGQFPILVWYAHREGPGGFQMRFQSGDVSYCAPE